MRSSALVASALIAAVGAMPARTVTDIIDVYTTVYEAAPTTSAEPAQENRNWFWNFRGAGARTTTIVVEETVAPTPVKVASASVVKPVQNTAAAQAAAAPAAPAVAAAPASGYNAYNGDTYARRVVDHHNAHRANHSAPNLQWDANLANIAYQIANGCNYAHDTKTGGGGYGQNIAAGAPVENITSVISDLFYNGEMPNFNGLYGQATPSNLDDVTKFDGYGHFTQIVWKSTTKVGCATVNCHGRGNGPDGLGNVAKNVAPIFTVCNYGPPGNYRNEFDKNVLKPLGQASIGWDYKY